VFWGLPGPDLVPYLPQNGLQQHPGRAVGTVWLLSCSAGLALMGVSCCGSCAAGHFPAFGAGLATLKPRI